MAEFFSWAATGLVVGLQTWSEADDADDRAYTNGHAAPRAHSGALVGRQRFFLRQRDGREIEIYLVDSGITFRNGHAVTAVWAARQGAAYGHCIYLENHTTGAIARLPENVAAIRTKARPWKVAGLGFLAAFPVALTLMAWLIYRRGPDFMHQKAFFVSASIALVLLMIIGAVIAKLISDYMRTDDDHKIWSAADKALANARRVLLQKPVTKAYYDQGNTY